ncbi:hypothetical protein MTO96_007925 [Rhipicephalus appendiculatus]
MEMRRRPTSKHQDSIGDNILAPSKELLLENGQASGDGHHNDKDYAGSVLEEWRSIALLLFLYVLQGVPLGLASAMPLLLQNRRISYKEQALFSLAAWPFSYAIGLSFFWLSSHVRFLLGEGEGSSKAEPSVLMLTFVFFSLNFLAATQDIAVDGWALTMLSRRHVGYASTCNSVGQTVGYIMGNVVFLALESADFCNRYLRSVPQKDGIVTLDGFLNFWGIVFMTRMAALIWEFFRRTRWRCASFSFPVSAPLCIFLITAKVGFAVADNVTGMKLLEAGMRRENLALLAIPVAPIQILLPVIISKHTGGNRPLNVYFKAYPYRLLLGLVFMILVHWTYPCQESRRNIPPLLLCSHCSRLCCVPGDPVQQFCVFGGILCKAAGLRQWHCGWWTASLSSTALVPPRHGSTVHRKKIRIYAAAKKAPARLR